MHDPSPGDRHLAHHRPCPLGAAASRPARQTWLLAELDGWFASDLDDRYARHEVVRAALQTATNDARAWLGERLEPGDLVRVDLLLDGPTGHRHSVFSTLPAPLALLLICLDQCRDGDEVTLVQELAKCGSVRASATWPFGMDEAEGLTRPARVGVPADA
jgi:hypothetical protein